MARIGFRFIWCTGPYFLLAFILSAFGITAMLSPWPALASPLSRSSAALSIGVG